MVLDFCNFNHQAVRLHFKRVAFIVRNGAERLENKTAEGVAFLILKGNIQRFLNIVNRRVACDLLCF